MFENGDINEFGGDRLLAGSSRIPEPPAIARRADGEFGSSVIARQADNGFDPSPHAPERCMLCPRACGARRSSGERGICGAGDGLVVARAALHFWEEPPISGNAGSGTVFFSHCPLRCVYCQNHEIAAGRAGKRITAERLAGIFLELQDEGALNINLVTPTHYLPQIKYAIDAARERGLALPIVYNTSGYETVAAVRSLAGYVDVYLTDFKYWSSGAARAYSHAPEYRDAAASALDEMVAQAGAPEYREVAGEDGPVLASGVVVRHMMLPGLLDDSRHLVAFLAERYGASIALSLMNQYTPLRTFPDHPELNERVGDADYEALLDFADELGIEEYFWQEGEAALESFVPAFDGSGV